MTAEQLEKLLAMLDNGHTLDPGRAMDELACLAPSLARRVLAAEKLVEAFSGMVEDAEKVGWDCVDERSALTAYRKARGL